MDNLKKTISRDGKLHKIDFTQRLAPLREAEVDEYIKSKGKKYTVLKLVEEMSELTQVLLKHINCGEKDKDGILEELGDVLLHLTCVQKIYNFTPASIHNRIAYKVIKRRVK